MAKVLWGFFVIFITTVVLLMDATSAGMGNGILMALVAFGYVILGIVLNPITWIIGLLVIIALK